MARQDPGPRQALNGKSYAPTPWCSYHSCTRTTQGPFHAEVRLFPWLSPASNPGLGDKDEAFAWLEKAYEERSTALYFLKVDSIWDPCAPIHAAMNSLRRVGLPP